MKKKCTQLHFMKNSSFNQQLMKAFSFVKGWLFTAHNLIIKDLCNCIIWCKIRALKTAQICLFLKTGTRRSGFLIKHFFFVSIPGVPSLEMCKIRALKSARISEDGYQAIWFPVPGPFLASIFEIFSLPPPLINVLRCPPFGLSFIVVL